MNMKHSKILTVVFAIGVCFTAFAQDKSSDAIKTDDRSYVKDFINEKAELVYRVDKQDNVATFKELSGRTVILKTALGTDMEVSHDSTRDKFFLKDGANKWRAVRTYLMKDDTEGAIKEMRKIVYPLIPLVVLNKNTFDASEYIDQFISALLETKRYVELTDFVKELPLGAAEESIINNATDVALALANNGNTKDALAIVSKIELKEKTQFNASEGVLKVLAVLRNKGMKSDVYMLYAKFGAVSENPHAQQFKLWSIYCDIAMGNRTSAELALKKVKMKQSDTAFSLYKMIMGDYVLSDAKNKDHKRALSSYSEGIVFGKFTEEWMSELLYKTGMSYKAIGNFVASNEIFEQIKAIYSDSPFAEKGAKEIVKIEKKKVVDKGMSHDDDDDDDDDDDE